MKRNHKNPAYIWEKIPKFISKKEVTRLMYSAIHGVIIKPSKLNRKNRAFMPPKSVVTEMMLRYIKEINKKKL